MVLEEKGSDHQGTSFQNIQEMWDKEVERKEEGKKSWYGHSLSYWKRQESSVDGMLGGLGFLADLDVAASLKFLKSLPGLSVTERKGKALDCGAGIGRVSENLLLKLFEKVDLVEPNSDFIKKAKETLPTGSVDRCYEMGLQDFVPESGAVYDCIWIQWVIIYLTDCDFVKFLERAASALASPTSFICIKDNVMRPGLLEFSLDRDDSSVTRSEAMLKDIFQKAGLKIVKREEQSDFPRELFPVVMYALQKI